MPVGEFDVDVRRIHGRKTLMRAVKHQIPADFLVDIAASVAHIVNPRPEGARMVVQAIERARFKNVRPHANDPLPRSSMRFDGQLGNTTAYLGEGLSEDPHVLAAPR